MEFQEFKKLKNLLINAGIPFDEQYFLDGPQLFYPVKGNSCVCIVASFTGSYASSPGLLDIIGLTKNNNAEGWLNAEEVFFRIQKHYHGQ